MPLKPVIRWAGSKRKLLPELRCAAPDNFTRYIEPFAGSAALFFDLLPSTAIIGDINPEIITTYRAIRDNPDEVHFLLTTIPLTNTAYYQLRALSPEALSDTQRAARLIYLMKTCFNGVYRTNKTGQFNVPIGNKTYLLPDHEHINEVSKALKNTSLHCGDFEFILNTADQGDFVYIDPPYSDGTRFRGEYGYAGSFLSHDQERLVKSCEILSERGARVLLSFKECANLRESLKGWNFRSLKVARSVAGFSHARATANEILISNY